MIRTALLLALAGVTASVSPARGQQLNPPSAPDSARVLALRPGDVVRVAVWGHEELSGDFPVDENHDLFYPVIGALNVRGMPVPQLRDRLRTELERLFQQPFLVVTPLFRIAVLGEVMRPSLYSIDPTMTVFDVVAEAGGPTRDANQRRIQLVRDGRPTELALDAAAVGRATLRELGVRSGDHIVVARKRFTREDLGLILQAATFVLVAYSVFR